MGASSFSARNLLNSELLLVAMMSVSIGHREPVDFYVPVLDHPQVDLHEVLFVLEDFVAEMDSSPRNPRQRAAPQVEAVRVVRVRDVEQPLDGLFSRRSTADEVILSLAEYFPVTVPMLSLRGTGTTSKKSSIFCLSPWQKVLISFMI